MSTPVSIRSTSTTFSADLINCTDEQLAVLPVQDIATPPKWDPRLQMIMYPVTDYYGRRLGYVRRHYKELNDWWSGSKAANVVESDVSPWCHFPAGQDITDSLYIVEDLPSAEAMRPYVPVCALLGTNVTDEVLGLFLRIGIKNLHICLDEDALAKAARLKRKLSLTFDNIYVTFVDKDPKDMTYMELIDKFGGN